jgi:hypothetical protein
MITDVVSTLKNLLHHLDEEIEEHTRQRDFYVAALANETESPARASMQSSVLLHNEIIHTLWGIADRHDVCPCGCVTRYFQNTTRVFGCVAPLFFMVEEAIMPKFKIGDHVERIGVLVPEYMRHGVVTRVIPNTETNGLDWLTEYEVNFDNQQIATFYETQLRLVESPTD